MLLEHKGWKCNCNPGSWGGSKKARCCNTSMSNCIQFHLVFFSF